MVESFINNQEKRVFFPHGEQHKFLLEISKNCGFSWPSLANMLGISKRTFFDWRREKYSLPFSCFKKMCKVANLDIPKNIEIREPFWSTKYTARTGGLAMYHKYGTIGNPLIRKQRWQQWWKKSGKYNPNKYFVAQDVTKPKKSKKLAEFVGIMMGDGGITKRQLRISLNSVVDKPYSIFIKNLITDLFEVKPSMYVRKNESTMNVVVSRTNLVKLCQTLGLKVGNKIKQDLDIPDWIKENKEFQKACIRGLMDTDGCLFMERHRIKEKIYSYPRLSLVSASPSLRHSVCKALIDLRFSARIRNNRSVQIENYLDIKNYFAKIGTNHPKNKEKFLALFGGFG